ncbi:MAG: helix-turn-helix domain-containing protein, partial [Myxococcota bacterium]|nr:helix-turn-helix domain-containing protein [Myxococcota bacterium]
MEFTPVGTTSSRPATFRLVAATNRDLEEAIEEGTFREDLFFRLDVVRLDVPPLRARPMDIRVLSEHFLKMYADMHLSRVDGFTDDAIRLLEGHDWPGNIRELENLIQGILVLKAEGKIEAQDIAGRMRGRSASQSSEKSSEQVTLPEEGLNLKSTVAQLERDLIRQALKRSSGNKAQAANLLGMNRTTLVEKLKREPLPPEG